MSLLLFKHMQPLKHQLKYPELQSWHLTDNMVFAGHSRVIGLIWYLFHIWHFFPGLPEHKHGRSLHTHHCEESSQLSIITWAVNPHHISLSVTLWFSNMAASSHSALSDWTLIRPILIAHLPSFISNHLSPWLVVMIFVLLDRAGVNIERWTAIQWGCWPRAASPQRSLL